MAKITGAHLQALLAAFRSAIISGDISVEQGKEFCDATFTIVQEQEVTNAKTGVYAPRAVVDKDVEPVASVSGRVWPTDRPTNPNAGKTSKRVTRKKV